MTRSEEFKRVRRTGKSFAHPLLVLYFMHTEKIDVHVGVSAGLAVGNAVERNRAKRLLREAMNSILPMTKPGSQVVLIARPALAAATLQETHAALSSLMDRAGLITQNHES